MSQPPGRNSFPETRWSRVVRARDWREEPSAREALEELCRLYWYPLYCFARRKGWSPEDAQDRTQEFFRSLVHQDLLDRPEPAEGRLRTFLLRVFERDLADARRAEGRLRRGGGMKPVPLDLVEAEERFAAEKAPDGPPPASFDRAWAASVLAVALSGLEESYQRAGKAGVFRVLRRFLDLSRPEDCTCGEAAAALGMDAAAVRQAIHRIRERFRIQLRQRIADTLAVADEAAVDEELAALRLALRDGVVMEAVASVAAPPARPPDEVQVPGSSAVQRSSTTR